jgi:hypothetical protein
MPTLADLKASIARDLDADDGYYDADVNEAVSEAIRHYAKEIFYFNELDGLTISTVAGQEWYGAGDDAALPFITNIDALWMIDSGLRAGLCRKFNQDIEGGASNLQGRPYAYAHVNKRVRLYPVPDGVYTFKINGLRTYPEPEDDNGDSPWADDAYDLIRARALARLGRGVLRDRDRAVDAAVDESEALDALRSRTTAMRAKGYIEADLV